MTEGVFSRFIGQIIDDTLQNKVQWLYADELQREYNQLTSHSQHPVLFQMEFSMIDFRRSYYCNTNAGMLYLVYHSNFPGEDGESYSEGYTLELQLNPYSGEFVSLANGSKELSCRLDELYRLEDAIRSRISRGVNLPFYDGDFLMNLYLGQVQF